MLSKLATICNSGYHSKAQRSAAQRSTAQHSTACSTTLTNTNRGWDTECMHQAQMTGLLTGPAGKGQTTGQRVDTRKHSRHKEQGDGHAGKIVQQSRRAGYPGPGGHRGRGSTVAHWVVTIAGNWGKGECVNRAEGRGGSRGVVTFLMKSLLASDRWRG